MKDYQRITKDKERRYVNFMWKSDDCFLKIYNRLADLESKIESGEIDYVVDKDAEISRLTSENAKLRARLEKAVEFPFENLDKVFILAGEDTKAKQFIPVRIVEGTIVGFGYDVYEWANGNYKFNYHVLVGENNYIFALEQFNKTLFKTREAAEARLAELKGGTDEHV